MRSWLLNPGQFGGNLRGVWYLVYPNSSMWSGLEAFIPLNLSTQEVRVLASWSNMDLFGGGRRGNTSEAGSEDRGSTQFSALGVSEARYLSFVFFQQSYFPEAPWTLTVACSVGWIRVVV